MVVVPELSEVDRYLNALGSDWFETPDSSDDYTKTESLIRLMFAGRNIVTTHSLYERIRKFEHLLYKYNVVIDEIPAAAKQVPTEFGPAIFKNLLFDKGYIKVDPVTRLINHTDKWLLDADQYEVGDDKHVRKFMDRVSSADVYYVSGTYCVMPLPDSFFTKPKSLTIVTFLFEGTQLDHYMKMRGYQYNLQSDPNELVQFRYDMNRRMWVYNKSIDQKTGFAVMTGKDPKARKKVSNFVKNVFQQLKKSGIDIPKDQILVASHKDAFHGKELSGSSNVDTGTSLKKVARLTDSHYTALVTRGTNKFRHLPVLVVAGKLNMNPGLANFLNMQSRKAQDMHAISELIQLIYRTSIRDRKDVFLIVPDRENIRLLKQFLRP